jgi:nucleotide-binding universal stress UspA family protein
VRLLVGLDHREGGEDALELAHVLAHGQGASALLATVLFTGPLPMGYALLPEEEEGEAAALFAAARKKLQGVEVETRAYGGGSPAGILTTLAEQEGCDAIVVGSAHRGTLGRVMIGSVAESLLNGASVDVAIAPQGYAEAEHQPPRSIAVGFDGTPEAKAALRRAEELAKRYESTIEIVTVVRPPVAMPAMVASTYSPEYPPQPEKVMAEAMDSIDSAIGARRTRLDGDPASELVRACEEGVELLVLGSRGYGPLTRVLLGSVSREVVRRASCPVLVVSRP